MIISYEVLQLAVVFCCGYIFQMGLDTVDGTNPAPVNMVNIPLFPRFYTSQVVQDFFRQQYEKNVLSACFRILIEL